MEDTKAIDWWNKNKVGTRGMFITVWAVFVVMSIVILMGKNVDVHFQDMIGNLVMYITIFVAVGANGIEKLADVYAKVRKK